MTVRDRLLDATVESLKAQGIRRTTVAQVADRAGVSRAWLYRHFPDKASLVGAAIIRLDEDFWQHAHDRIGKAHGIAAQVAEAVAISRAHEPPLTLQLREQEPEAFALVVGSGLREVVPGMATFWHGYLEDAVARGEARADLDVPRAAEWVLRVVISLVTVPSETDVLPLLEEFLLPSLT